MNEKFRIIDCFCGAGGLSLGFEQAGFDVVYAFDLDKTAIETYKHNAHLHHGQAFVRDIYNVSKSSIEADLGHALGQIDVVIGGPPCQGFSVQRRGDDNDPRNQLVLEYVRLLKEIQPRFFIMENVGGILSHRGAPYIRALFENMDAAGYTIQQKKLVASDYGVPQDRTRVIIVGELTNGGESTVSDEYNTKFFSLKRYDDSLGETFVTYYAHITNFDPQYSVIVKGDKGTVCVNPLEKQ